MISNTEKGEKMIQPIDYDAQKEPSLYNNMQQKQYLH